MGLIPFLPMGNTEEQARERGLDKDHDRNTERPLAPSGGRAEVGLPSKSVLKKCQPHQEQVEGGPRQTERE